MRKVMLALLKLGLKYDDIQAMPEYEAMAFIETYGDIINPNKTRRYVVKRNP